MHWGLLSHDRRRGGTSAPCGGEAGDTELNAGLARVHGLAYAWEHRDSCPAVEMPDRSGPHRAVECGIADRAGIASGGPCTLPPLRLDVALTKVGRALEVLLLRLAIDDGGDGCARTLVSPSLRSRRAAVTGEPGIRRCDGGDGLLGCGGGVPSDVGVVWRARPPASPSWGARPGRGAPGLPSPGGRLRTTVAGLVEGRISSSLRGVAGGGGRAGVGPPAGLGGGDPRCVLLGGGGGRRRARPRARPRRPGGGTARGWTSYTTF